MASLQRLVSLATQLRDRTPQIPRTLLYYIPQYEIVEAATKGVEAASEILGVPPEQIHKISEAGEDPWEQATPHAYRLAVANIVLNHPKFKALPTDKKLSISKMLAEFAEHIQSDMFEEEEYDLGSINEFPEIDKWLSGYEPVDAVTVGLYQALVILMGLPGTGKTSQMLSLMECIKRRNPSWRMLYFQIEIPGQLFLGRMKPIMERGRPFDSTDRLYAGAYSMERILELTCNYSDKNQVVFIDSPDAMTGPGASAMDGGRRFDLENIYRNLVRVKNHSQLVVTASQPRRADKVLTLTSTAESFAKAWYADIIIPFQPWGNLGQIKASTVKNRFGPNNLSVLYNYNYATLEAENVQNHSQEDEW